MLLQKSKKKFSTHEVQKHFLRQENYGDMGLHIYILEILISLCQQNSSQLCHITNQSHSNSTYKNFSAKSMNSEELFISLSYTWPFINLVSPFPMLTFMDRKALSRGPYRVIWESAESSSSTWSLSGGSSEGSRGTRVEAVGDEITLSAVFCDGLSTDNIVSSISDTLEQNKEENKFWLQVRLPMNRILQIGICIKYATFCR